MTPPDYVSAIVKDLEKPQGFSAALTALLSVDLEAVTHTHRQKIVEALKTAATLRGGSLLMLSLPANVQAELALFSQGRIPGQDRTVYLKATPKQVVRKLSGKCADNALSGLLLSKYNFSRFGKDDWRRYFEVCSSPIAAAKAFLGKGAAAGGFSDDEITNLVLNNPQLVQCIAQERLSPNTAIALLISGKAPSLWQTYDFARLNKNHWRELFLHTNPDVLPEASRAFVENKDGEGFSEDELLTMAQKCHALINFLNPDKVPFNIAYELYQTGRADLLWKNYPFAMLDKSEWRKILTNPNVRIPDMFVEVARSNRFKIDELCELATKNERLLPILVEIGIPSDKVVDLLLTCECEYLWAHYRFGKFDPADWERLILGLPPGQILKPNAMSALSSCRGITESQATRILNKDTVYCPHLPLTSVSPDMVVEILMRGKGYFLWDKYDFSRLNDGQWLRLLGGISGSIHEVEKKFLAERASAVDNGQLNIALARREELIEFVDQRCIATDLAVDVLTRKSSGELWRRYDFTRFNGKQLCQLLKKTGRTSDWPDSLRNCFKSPGQSLNHGDLLEIALENPSVVIELLSTDWASTMEDDQFGKLMAVCVRKDSGCQAILSRLRSASESWKDLGIEKLKQLLIALPEARKYVEWQSWPFVTIASLIDANTVFADSNPHPIRFFFWKHARSLAAMAALTVAAFCLIIHQNSYLAAKEKQRNHWNAIVNNIRTLDANRSFEELAASLPKISSEDMSVISNDVFVQNAQRHLLLWEDGKASATRSVDRIRKIRDGNWERANASELTNLFSAVEANEYASRSLLDECAKLKNAWQCHLEEIARRKQCDDLRNALENYKVRMTSMSKIAELEQVCKKADESKPFAELAGLASRVRAMAVEKMEAIRKVEIEKSLVTVSNGVEQIFMTIRSPGGFKAVAEFPVKRKALQEEVGHGQYCEQHPGRFEELIASMDQYAAMKADVEEKKKEADALAEQFKREFMTVEAGTICSNLIIACDAGVVKANRLGGWADPIEAYNAVKKTVDGIQARDLRCWNLVDQLNGATTYEEYLLAKNALVKEYGTLTQLKHLANHGKLSVADAARYFKFPRRSYWGGDDKYRYHFVGVIRLAPEDTQSVCINVNNKAKVTNRADLYTLTPGRNSTVASEKLIQQSDNKYYRVDGVNYTGCQGAPLFVRSEHFTGKE